MESLWTEVVNGITRSTFSESLVFTCEEAGFLKLCPIQHKKIFAGEKYIFYFVLFNFDSFSKKTT